ncbi:uncharacterized protein LOC144867902 [Branchiostoma floridae x Branchiostoma japonicum]
MVGRFSGELQLANSTCTPHIAVQGQSPVQLPERRKPTFCSATAQILGGVGLVVSKHIYKCLQSVNSVSERILTVTFHGNPQLTITVIYAPTESASPADKDDFYSTLKDHIEMVKKHDKHLVIGDFNARIGHDSHVSHPVATGPHCYYSVTNDNGDRLVNLCQEHKLRPAQTRFPHPRSRLWTWMHPGGSTHQLDHILINGKWVNSLRNCRAYNSVELDSDHRILSVLLVTSLRTSKGKPCRRPKFNWRKLREAHTREVFQMELSNRFEALKCDEVSSPITERYACWEKTVAETAEKVVGRCKSCGMPSWVSAKTLELRDQRDKAKKRFLLAKTRQSKETWRRTNQKVKKRDGTAPSSDNELLAEWREYFSELLNNVSVPQTSGLPPPADQDLPICVDPPTLEETVRAINSMKNNKAPGLDCAITAEALRGGDFKKAFDSIDRKVMLAVLRHYGIPLTIVNAINVLYNNSKSAVMVDGNISDPFQVTTGVLQGDVLAPFLFIVLIDFLMRRSTEDIDSGIVTHPRQSRRYPARILNDMDFADDIALLESSIPKAQEQLNRTAAAGTQLGLVISVPKTEYMTINCSPQPPLEVYGQPIKNRVSNSEIYRVTNTQPLICKVRQRQLRFIGHALRMPLEEPLRTYALYVPSHGKRRPGRKKTNYLTYIQNLLGDAEGDLNPTAIAALAADRLRWNRIVTDCTAAD